MRVGLAGYSADLGDAVCYFTVQWLRINRTGPLNRQPEKRVSLSDLRVLPRVLHSAVGFYTEGAGGLVSFTTVESIFSILWLH